MRRSRSRRSVRRRRPKLPSRTCRIHRTRTSRVWKRRYCGDGQTLGYVKLRFSFFATTCASGAERRILNTTDKSEDTTKFTAEEYTSRYDYHLATLEKLQKRSPTWFAEFQRNLYSVIVNSTTFNHLKAIVSQQEDSDDEDIDFSALEASIVKAAPQPTVSTQ
ncbi:hypothetical protein C8R44DRAFT_18348 [Mycena epipterygia]|nr:hypothetical protein C8R44DRAFT_18348 [Mycena epipterygia]